MGKRRILPACAAVTASLLMLSSCQANMNESITGSYNTTKANSTSKTGAASNWADEYIVTTAPPLAKPGIFTTSATGEREPAVTPRSETASTTKAAAASSTTTNANDEERRADNTQATTTQKAAATTKATTAAATTAPAPTTSKATTKPATTAPQAANATTRPATTAPATTKPATSAPGAATDDGFLEEQEKQVAALINQLRKSLGEGELTFDAGLCLAARIRSEEMCQSNYLEHKRPDGRQWSTVLAEAGVSGLVAMGENIAMMEGSGDHTSRVTANAWYEMWKNSSGHYKNMVSSSYTKVGLGIVLVNENGKYKAYATTIFGK